MHGIKDVMQRILRVQNEVVKVNRESTIRGNTDGCQGRLIEIIWGDAVLGGTANGQHVNLVALDYEDRPMCRSRSRAEVQFPNLVRECVVFVSNGMTVRKCIELVDRLERSLMPSQRLAG